MTPSERWRPLSARDEESGSHEVLEEGVPEHLEDPIIRWVEDYCPIDLFGRVALRLRIRMTVQSARGLLTQLLDQRDNWQTVWLDVMDAVLFELEKKRKLSIGTGGYPPPPVAALRLDEILELGGSAWRVDSDTHDRLVRRVNATANEAMERTVEKAAQMVPSAGKHLAASWRATYGRKPEPTFAYGEAIRAVEAASAPVVTPNDKKATLGTIVAEMEKKPERWALSIAPGNVDVVVTMMRSLWRGQTDRHGGISPTEPVSQAAAEAGVHMAVVLVQWFVSGEVTRTELNVERVSRNEVRPARKTE